MDAKVRETGQRMLDAMTATLLDEHEACEARMEASGIPLNIWEWVEAEVERGSDPSEVIAVMVVVFAASLSTAMDMASTGGDKLRIAGKLMDAMKEMVLSQIGKGESHDN